MFTFLWWYLGFLLIMPIFALFLPSVKNSIKPMEIYFPHLESVRDIFTSQIDKSTSKKPLIILLWLFWICIILSLMRPVWLSDKINTTHNAYDIMLAVDISPSMDALDFSSKFHRISRLDVAKKVVGDFANNRTKDRIGLILFGEYPYLQAPMSFDTQTISRMLYNASSGMAGNATSIGDTIVMATNHIRKHSKSKMLILLTDGTDNSSTIPPLEATRIAKKYDIKIYTIGIGTNGAVPYPDKFGNIVMRYFKLDENLLQKISSMSNGQYFRAKDNMELEEIYKKIDEIEKIEVTKPQYRNIIPLYRYPLGIACFVFLIIWIIPLIKRYKSVSF